jgi:hypothetical protein
MLVGLGELGCLEEPARPGDLVAAGAGELAGPGELVGPGEGAGLGERGEGAGLGDLWVAGEDPGPLGDGGAGETVG